MEHKGIADIYITVYAPISKKWGVVRFDNFKFDSIEEAEDAARFLSEQYKAASLMGSSKSTKKAASSRENGKKGGRPRQHDYSYLEEMIRKYSK